MKAATGSFRIETTENAPANNQEQNNSSLLRYALVVILVAMIFLLSSWNPESNSSEHLSLGFVWFWLIGGVVTLSLLFFAAKKQD